MNNPGGFNPNMGNFGPPNMPSGNSNPNEQVPNGQQQMPQMSQMPTSFEREGSWSKSVSRSKQTRQATNFIINSREELARFLKQSGVDLLTSATEFQQTGDFIQSSYVVYKEHNNYKEPLNDFLNRYPQLKQVAEDINNQLRPVQQHMNVITKPPTSDLIDFNSLPNPRPVQNPYPQQQLDPQNFAQPNHPPQYNQPPSNLDNLQVQ